MNPLLVTGYHHCTPVPSDLRARGLKARTALVIDPSDTVDMLFDSNQWLSVINAVGLNLGSTAVTVIDDVGEKSLADLEAEYASKELCDREPPQSVVFYSGKKVRCWMESEFWLRCGGPHPYHDSYTFAFYTVNDDVPLVVHALQGVLGKNLDSTIKGTEDPQVKSSWYMRLVSLLANMVRSLGRTGIV